MSHSESHSDNSDILQKILATKAQEIAQQKQIISLEMMKEHAKQANINNPVRDFIGAIRAKHANNIPALIAEIKKASPSKGLIRKDFNPIQHAKDYEQAGVACLSVLTDEPYFQGSPEYLKQARQAVNLPVLRKDFMIDEYQIYQARAWGADAILLIAAALDSNQLKYLENIAHELGMTVLLELHDKSECDKTQDLSTQLRGVNNRNLRTFEVNLSQTIDLLDNLNQIQDCIVVTESGIRDKSDVDFMRSHGVNTFLIGETFMRAENIVESVKNLLL